MTERAPHDMRELQLFVVELGAAMNAAGEAVYSVEERLKNIAHASRRRRRRDSAASSDDDAGGT